MDLDTQIINKIPANVICYMQYVKLLIYYDRVEFIPGIQGRFNNF